MAGISVNNGEKVALEYLVAKVTSPETLDIKLYSNDKTPAEGDTAVAYTEATFSGYADATLVGANFNVTLGDPSDATYNAQVVFTSDADQTAELIYGYYLVRTTTQDLVAAERFTTAPITIQNAGDAIKITPKITMT